MRRFPILALTRTASAALAAVALALVTGPAAAAVDPDVDPAEPLDIQATVEAVDIQVVAATAQLQTPSVGGQYLRIDLTLENVGSEPLHAVDWSVMAQDVQVTLSPNAVIDPGQQVTISQVVLGTSVGSLNPSTAVFVNLASRSSGTLCQEMPTREMCEAFAASTQELCAATCVGRGVDGGQVVCSARPYKDANGVTCTQYLANCVCNGRSTLTEGLSNGLIDPNDPLMQDIVTYPPLIEARTHDIFP